MNNDETNQYLNMSLLDLSAELFKRDISYRTLSKHFKNVSTATISHTLNDGDIIPAKTREKVRKRICTYIKAFDKRKQKKVA